jgi:excisionase family DNA binding protein
LSAYAPQPYLTPPEIAKLLRFSQEKVLGWIRRGVLWALDVGNGRRPRYRVSRTALDDFLKAREFKPPSPRPERKRQAPEGGQIDPKLGKTLLKRGQPVLLRSEYYRVWNGTILFYYQLDERSYSLISPRSYMKQNVDLGSNPTDYGTAITLCSTDCLQ